MLNQKLMDRFSSGGSVDNRTMMQTNQTVSHNALVAAHSSKALNLENRT